MRTKTKKLAASSRPDRLTHWSEEDMRTYARSSKAKEDSERLREHLRKHGGEPTPADLAEIPALTEEELNAMRPVKQQLTIRLDTDILDWLKSKRGPYQTRLNDILRAVMLRDRAASSRSSKP
jgi:uncharacterized protein (DUF4415 family)